MFQLNVLSGTAAGRSIAIRRFPFAVGRAETNLKLAQDIAQALMQLRQWGAGPGSRIGIFAPNS